MQCPEAILSHVCKSTQIRVITGGGTSAQDWERPKCPLAGTPEKRRIHPNSEVCTVIAGDEAAPLSWFRKVSGLRPGRPAQSPSGPALQFCTPCHQLWRSPPPASTCYSCCGGASRPLGRSTCGHRAGGAGEDVPQAGPGPPTERWGEPSSWTQVQDKLGGITYVLGSLQNQNWAGSASWAATCVVRQGPSIGGLILGLKLGCPYLNDFSFLFCTGLCNLCSQAWLWEHCVTMRPGWPWPIPDRDPVPTVSVGCAHTSRLDKVRFWATWPTLECLCVLVCCANVWLCVLVISPLGHTQDTGSRKRRGWRTGGLGGGGGREERSLLFTKMWFGICF